MHTIHTHIHISFGFSTQTLRVSGQFLRRRCSAVRSCSQKTRCKTILPRIREKKVAGPERKSRVVLDADGFPQGWGTAFRVKLSRKPRLLVVS